MADPTQFAYRTLKEINVINAAPFYEPLPGFKRPEGNLRCCVYSPCGRYFAWASPASVTIINASAGHAVVTILARNVYELAFSPLGTFIITWQRPGKSETGDATKNLNVWLVDGKAAKNSVLDEHDVLGSFVQKAQTGWNLQYTCDERYCARVVTNEVQFYQSEDLGSIWTKLRVEGVADFALSPSKSHSIAVFIPERKGQPAAVKVFNLPSLGSAVSQKNFYKGDKVQLKWNQDGTSLIVLAQTEVDKSGKSYYGETTLYILSANGGFDSRIELDKEGPIHDVTWSPNSQEFGVVYGYMPAKTTLFSVRAVATHSFALSPRNTILFSPSGRFVLVAGFGNLAGQMDIYDLEKDNLKVCTIEASNSSICAWSPDGKYILTATTSPRLRVDNGVRVWHISGSLVYNQELEDLYQVTWRPQLQPSKPIENPLHPLPKPHSSALTYLGTVKTPSKPTGAYRPPGARGQLTPMAFKREDEGGVAFVSNGSFSLGSGANGFGKPRKRVIPGADVITDDGGEVSVGGNVDKDEMLSKAAVKNKKKREAKKAKEVTDKAAGLMSGFEETRHMATTHPSGSPERKDKKTRERNLSKGSLDALSQPRQAERRSRAPRTTPSSVPEDLAPTTQAMADTTITSLDNGGSLQDKKIRALLKKLRAIDDLKMRRACGEKLEGTQIKKMNTEDVVRKELNSLGWSD